MRYNSLVVVSFFAIEQVVSNSTSKKYIVAEGVEDMESVDFLKNAGCDMVQGYVFSKPVPVEEFERKAFGVSCGDCRANEPL